MLQKIFLWCGHLVRTGRARRPSHKSLLMDYFSALVGWVEPSRYPTWISVLGFTSSTQPTILLQHFSIVTPLQLINF
ncbi:MAG: hypothetical protein RMY29_018070 [Nostoc sp. CreGUA01]|nr:hypothetical protein [Nostoc sp. CreGUA01]